ncbi:MAG TPA: hypothetical protein DCK99_04760 [Blastocatellia bacterium]|nr:hypothetical protein [Blastocatellia bacterium]
MKRAAWPHSLAGLPLSKIALAIRAKAQAVDQRTIVVMFVSGVSHYPFLCRLGRAANWDSRKVHTLFAVTLSDAEMTSATIAQQAYRAFPPGYRARETYKILGPDEFVEVFELAEHGKDFELDSESHWRRKK